MPGYLNRFIDIDLAEYGEGCYIRIHNPKIVPQSMLEPSTKVAVGPDGKPTDPDAAREGSNEVLARLVKDWHIYDATDLDTEEQPLLTLPATAESVKKLPMGVWMKLNKLVADAIPDPT